VKGENSRVSRAWNGGPFQPCVHPWQRSGFRVTRVFCGFHPAAQPPRCYLMLLPVAAISIVLLSRFYSRAIPFLSDLHIGLALNTQRFPGDYRGVCIGKCFRVLAPYARVRAALLLRGERDRLSIAKARTSEFTKSFTLPFSFRNFVLSRSCFPVQLPLLRARASLVHRVTMRSIPVCVLASFCLVLSSFWVHPACVLGPSRLRDPRKNSPIPRKSNHEKVFGPE
jgi:hypothetical protein